MPGPAVLVDAGALIALFNKTDSEHQLFRRFFADYYGEALTTWPVLTEAEHAGVHEIVTTDRTDFEFYRMRSGRALRILPTED